MTNNDHLHLYETFYQEIPTTDYLKDFDIEIEDHVEDTDIREGLDASQVSRLAQDNYEQSGNGAQGEHQVEQEQTLFTKED